MTEKPRARASDRPQPQQTPAVKGRRNASYPYGYRPTGFGRVSVNEAEQEAIARIVELRSTDLSYRRIAAVLDEEGRTPRRAGRWSPMSVRSIAIREIGM